jgi:peroxiredoxin family protein
VTPEPASAPTPALAAILATGERERLYTGLSALVTTAADGDRCLALATFRSLELLLEPPLPEGEGNRFDRSLAALIAAANELDRLELYACAATVDLLEVPGNPLGGVLSMPRFLRAARGAELVFV